MIFLEQNKRYMSMDMDDKRENEGPNLMRISNKMTFDYFSFLKFRDTDGLKIKKQK